MSRSRTLVAILTMATLTAITLTACGGPTTPPPPPDPTVTTVSPTIAPRGDTITITGEDFGTTQGTLTIGNTPATITTWSDTQVEATIAPGTPDGWQEVQLTTPDGTDSFTPFFVGVEFTGVANDLQAFLDGLDQGTAVLLQAQTYDLSASPDGLILDNHGLYGRGATQTTLLTPTGTGMVVLADFGEELTIADMAMAGDNIGFYHGTVAGLLGTLDAGALAPASLDDIMIERMLTLPATAAMPDLSSLAAPSQGALDVDAAASLGALGIPSTALESLTIDAFTETPSLAVVPADVTTPKITLQGVTYSEVAGGFFGIPMMVLPAIDLVLDDTTLELDNSVAYLFSARDVTLDGATVSAGMAYLLSFAGALSIVDSVVESASDASLGAETGLTVHASTVRALDGSIEIVGAAGALMGGSGTPTGGPIEIDGSTIEALDGDLADATTNGVLEIVTQYAPIVLTDNVRIRAHDSAAIVTLESAIGEGDITFSDNADVRVGVFKADDAVNFRPAALQILTTGGPSLPDTITLNGTTIAATNALLVVAGTGGQSGIVNASGSSLTAGDGDDNGVIQITAGTSGWLELDGNAFESDSVIVISAPDLDGHSANLSNNAFTADGDGASQLMIQSIGGSGTLSGNSLSATDPGDDTASTVVVMCGGVDPLTDTCTIDGNAFTATGNGASAVLFATANLGLGFTSNQVTTETTLLTQVNDTEATFASNDIALGAASWVITGNAGTELIFDSNVVTYDSVPGYAFGLSGIGTSTVTGNSFTDLGTPGANAVAFGFATTTDPIAVSASGNTFSNFSRALYAADAAAPADGIDATIQNNVFDFTIDAAPKVAELNNVKDVIDARFNQWGANTDLATVQGYVTYSGDTNVQGGDIDLDPITAP